MPRQKSHHVDSAAALAGRLRAAREHAEVSQRQLALGICTAEALALLEHAVGGSARDQRA